MNTSSRISLLLPFLLSSVAMAQQPSGRISPLAEPAEKVKKSVAQAVVDPDTAARVTAPPLPAGNAKLATIRERARAIQKKHAQYLKDVASGKIVPQAHLRKMRPHQIKKVKELQASYQLFQTEKDPNKVDLISKALLAGLQPIGPHLKPAAPGKGYLNYLSNKQQTELQKLEDQWDAADKDYNTKAKPLHFIGLGQLYTLTNLSVPLAVQAPPHSTVIFRTHAGGFFSNKLAYQAVRADKTGIARADWVTYGDSIGDNFLSVRSAEAAPAQNLTITTVQLKLIDLPELPKIQAQAPAQPKLNLQKKAQELTK